MSQTNGFKEEPGATLPASDAERWIAGTYAIWSEYCGGSCKYLGGYEKTEANAGMVAKVLEEDWMVTDHDSGVEMVKYLLEHAGPDGDGEEYDEEFDEGFDEDGEYDRDGEDFGDEDDEDYDEEYDDDYDDDDECDNYKVDTTAFDYACACNMCGRMFIAGYFTREEAMSYATEAAKKIQELYGSWAEYFQEYIFGAAGGSNMKKLMPFAEAYQKVLCAPENPVLLDWNTRL